MIDFFPTDVRVHIQGDGDAFGLIPVARNMLRKAQLMRATMPGPIQLRSSSPGGLVSVLMHGDLKIITITPTPPVPTTEEAAPGLYVLCGMIRDGTIYVDPGTGTRYLRSYRPTIPTSLSHGIPDGFNDNARLCPPTGGNGSGTQYNTVKGSMYSGSMKRVVQAVQGLGHINDKSPAYLTPEPASRYVTVKYSSGITTTHGIVNTGPKNNWLIEISSSRGVLAMPLPLIRSTTGKAYRKHLATIGDLGGLAIVDEFGGLPSGETFPTGAALTTAIAKGMVLQLLSDVDLHPVYQLPDPTQDFAGFQSSWAFSLTTGRARATRILRTLFSTFPNDGIGSNVGSLPSIVGEHWEIAISLTQHDLSAVGRHEPVGVGTASLEKLDAGRLSRSALNTLFTPVGGELLSALSIFEGDFIDKKVVNYNFITEDNDGWGAVGWSYFDEDVPIILQWVPEALLSEGTHYDVVTGSYIDPDTGFDLVPLQFPGYTSRVVSPEGWVGAIDLRETDNFYQAFTSETIDQFYVYCCTSPGVFCAELSGAVETVDVPDRPTPGLDIWCGKFLGFDPGSVVPDVGNPTHPIPEIRDVLMWAMITGMCRESHACVRHEATGDGGFNTIGIAHMGDVGEIGLNTSDRWVTPRVSDRVYFGAVINGSKNYPAYCSTGYFEQVQATPPGHPYERVNLLAGEESTIPQNMNFIGDMTP